MDTKKVLFWPVLISIIGHISLISISSMIDIRDDVRPAEVLTIEIKSAEPELKPKQKQEDKKEVKKEIKKPKPVQEEKAVNGDDWREDTVDLGSTDIKYASYLYKIKKQILKVWLYPQKAYEKNEEGTVVVKMAIDADGSIAETRLMASSGSAILDESALNVVRAASPYDSLPGTYNLSRLNITASFRYRLMD
jgi:TonB family protein